MIVDDDPTLLLVIGRLLEKQGFEVKQISDPLKTIAAIREWRPDAVVLDTTMPHLSGIELCRAIRAEPESGTVPILFLSATGRAMDIQAGLQAGANDYLCKPADLTDLPRRIALQLGA
jgi:DNA-binding response OmpR family regulator